MAGTFGQLEEILTQLDIWAQETKEHDDVLKDDADNDNSGATSDEPSNE